MLNKYIGYVSLLVAIFALGFQIGVKNTSNKYEEQIAGIYRDIEKSALQVDNKNKDISFVPVIVGKDLGNLQEKRNDKTNTVISGIDNGSVKLYDKSSASTGKNCDNASSARGDKEESSGIELSDVSFEKQDSDDNMLKLLFRDGVFSNCVSLDSIRSKLNFKVEF